MPSIYSCQFLGDMWSEWEHGMVLNELPELFAKDGVALLLTNRDGRDFCYLYDLEESLLTWASWSDGAWSDWADPMAFSPPPNFAPDSEDTCFSVVSQDDVDWLLSINLMAGTVYGCPIDLEVTEAVWEEPTPIEVAPNLDESTDIFAAIHDESEWVIAVDLEQQSVCYSEWNGEEYSSWESVPSLDLPEEWLEMGIDLDGAVVDEQLLVYAIVYDDDQVSL